METRKMLSTRVSRGPVIDIIWHSENQGEQHMVRPTRHKCLNVYHVQYSNMQWRVTPTSNSITWTALQYILPFLPFFILPSWSSIHFAFLDFWDMHSVLSGAGVRFYAIGVTNILLSQTHRAKVASISVMFKLQVSILWSQNGTSYILVESGILGAWYVRTWSTAVLSAPRGLRYPGSRWI
jgi:hypothetical protein